MKLVARLIVSLCLLVPLQPQAAEPLRIVTLTDFKPYVWCEKGVPRGIDSEIIRTLFARIEQPVVLECLPWKRALAYIQEGQADGVFSAYKTPLRETFAYFLEQPVHLTSFRLFVRKGETFSYQSIADLKDKRIGIQAGYSINPQFDAAMRAGVFETVEVHAASSGFQMLNKGRIDAYVQEQNVGLHVLSEMGDLPVTMLPDALHEPKPAYLMLSKKSGAAGRKEMVERLNQTISAMWQEGQIAKIINIYSTSLGTYVNTGN